MTDPVLSVSYATIAAFFEVETFIYYIQDAGKGGMDMQWQPQHQVRCKVTAIKLQCKTGA